MQSIKMSFIQILIEMNRALAKHGINYWEIKSDKLRWRREEIFKNLVFALHGVRKYSFEDN